jgi:hypothetical protein
MARRRTLVLAASLVLLLLTASGFTQETPKAPTLASPTAVRAESERERVPTATLRVQLVIGRFQGEKRLASFPYTLLVPARPLGVGGSRTRMRMGVDTPVPTSTMVGDAKNATATTSIQYRNVGTNIDCSANDLDNGRYQLSLNVENSSALAGMDDHSGRLDLAGLPLFRRFETALDLVLRDGQSVQTVASTDPVTGEVVKIDVTLSVVK